MMGFEPTPRREDRIGTSAFDHSATQPIWKTVAVLSRALASQFFSLILLFPEALSLAGALFQICIIYQYNSFTIISHHNIFPFVKNNFRRIRNPLKRD